MISSTLFIGAVFAFASAAIYFYVGHRLRRRQLAEAERRLAWTLFVVWWYGLAGTTLVSASLSLLGALGLSDLPLFTTLTQFNMLVVSVALYGLMYYLLYLFTGNSKLWAPLTLFYIANYFLLLYFVNAHVPVAVELGRWSTSLAYQNPPTGPISLVALALLIFPQIIGSVAYLSLFSRLSTPTQRYRVILVSVSLLVWFVSAFLASVSGLSSQDWWQIASRLIGLGATVTILMAYEPINWLKQRLGVLSLAEEPGRA